MAIKIRPIKEDDAATCGRIIYEAFRSIAVSHNVRPDFPTPEFAVGLAQSFVTDPHVFGVVAEGDDGSIVGSNFLWEYDVIRAVGPITVDPNQQSKGAGRRLMEAVIERGRGTEGIRLVQDAFNRPSLSLYASLGFDVREPLVMIEGPISGEVPKEIEVRPIREEDFAACAVLCRQAHGIERTGELRSTPPSLTSYVALRRGRLTAYASSPGFWALNHAVAETEADMQALLTGAGNLSGEQPLSLLLPTRQTSLFRWCLKKRMRVIKTSTLMTMGMYQEPRLCYLPSVGY